ncbi:MAG: hypothetical protein HY866_23520 [Chloroflexi bacterium]|nr:hypothetical protein [Chloroflexota bacterium]
MTDPTQTDAEQALAADLLTLRQANPPDAAFSADLETRLRAVIAARATSNPVVFSSNGRTTARSSHIRRSTRIVGIAASLALVVLLFLIVPALRTFAQDIIRQIGGILITDAPSPGEEAAKEWERVASTPALFRSDEPPDNAAQAVLQSTSGAQINAVVGFSVYEANNIEGRPPFGMDFYQIATREDSNLVIFRYSWYGNQVHLVEMRADDPALTPIWNRDPALPQGEAVTVRGEPGLWFSDFTLNDPQFQAQVDELKTMTGGAVKNIKLLTWREGNQAFIIQSYTFTLDLLQIMADSLSTVPDSRQFSSLWPPLTDAELTEQAGFPLYAPADLPDHYYLLGRYVTTLNGVKTIVFDYRYITPGWFADFLFHSDQLVLCQIFSSETYSLGLGDAVLTDVLVNNQPGVWIEQWARGAMFYAPALKETLGKFWDYERANVLVWETGGYTFTLHNAGALHLVDPGYIYEQTLPHLSQHDMLRIAESVAPVNNITP